MILHQLLRRTLVSVIVGLGLWTTVKSMPTVEYATDPSAGKQGVRERKRKKSPILVNIFHVACPAFANI